jgi:adenosine deaminase
MIRGAYEHMVADGVVYAEVSFDLLVPEFVGMAMEEFGEILAEEAGRLAGRIRIAPEIGISRKMAPDFAATLLAGAIAVGVFRAIDLYDDENYGAVSDFVPLYRLARDGGLKLKAHAGELCPAERVRESVLLLDLDAVQHGVRAAESPEVIDFLAARGTVLNVCPTSNCSLGVVGSFESHPARQLFERGVRITVNSDDFTLFGASVSDEILNLCRMGFTPDEIEQIVANGLAQIPR